MIILIYKEDLLWPTKGIEAMGNRFVDMSQPYDAQMNSKLTAIATSKDITSSRKESMRV